MKKILILIAGLSSLMMFSQEVVLSRYDLLGGSFSNTINSSTGKSFKYEDISGTPYLDKSFKEAKIAESYQNVMVRYNAFKDEVEFRNPEKDEIMIIPKDEKFKSIEILFPKQNLVLLNLNNEPQGYYYKIVSGPVSFLKKVKVNFIDARPASTPYGTDQPASFSTPVNIYYIVHGNKVIKTPKNQKEIISQFPDKKDSLSIFFKENKIKLDKEDDLKKLVTFLNQN